MWITTFILITETLSNMNQNKILGYKKIWFEFENIPLTFCRNDCVETFFELPSNLFNSFKITKYNKFLTKFKIFKNWKRCYELMTCISNFGYVYPFTTEYEKSAQNIKTLTWIFKESCTKKNYFFYSVVLVDNFCKRFNFQFQVYQLKVSSFVLI